MKVTVKIPASKPVESFLDYLKTRATAPEHADNGDLIADFVDKFLVVELKRLENEKDFVDQDIEIPDAAVLAPLMAAKKAFDLNFADFVKGRGGKMDAPAPAAPAIKEEDLEIEDPADAFAMDPSVRDFLGNDPVVAPRKRSGNGHQSLKKRDLYASEKDVIRAEFIAINGQIAEDACKPIHAKLDQEVSIAQVTGFVTYLHKKVAEGYLKLDKLDEYVEYLKGHRKIWETYDSPKYRAMRARSGGV